MFDHVSNEDLQLVDLPAQDATWGEIIPLAITFDGYTYWGDFTTCAQLGNRIHNAFYEGEELPDDLTQLRTALFFEQRRYHHFGYPPGESDLDYIRALVKAITIQVEKKK